MRGRERVKGERRKEKKGGKGKGGGEREDSLLHKVIVDELGHDGDGHGAWALAENLSSVLILQPDHVLTVDLTQVVVDEQSIAGGREGGREGGGKEGGREGGSEGRRKGRRD